MTEKRGPVIELVALILFCATVVTLSLHKLSTSRAFLIEQPSLLRQLLPQEEVMVDLFLAATARGISVANIKILIRIIRCESRFIREAINPRSRDFGLFQINERSLDRRASELGLDYKNSWRDNILLGLHIFETQGLLAWERSKPCWGSRVLEPPETPQISQNYPF